MLPQDTADGSYETDQEKIIIDEKEFIGLKDTDEVKGLAVSGGGIRSASFGLGVMQALVGNKQLEKIYYLSTVSGGGYLGSALTWALHQYKNSDTTKANFPLGKLKADGAKQVEKYERLTKNSNDFENLELEGNELLNFIRLHGAYLTPIDKLDIFSFSAVVLRSKIMSLFFYISFFTIAITASLFALYQLVRLIPIEKKAENSEFINIYLLPFGDKGVLLLVAIIIILVMVLIGFFFSFRTFFSKLAWNNWYESFI